MYVCVYITVTVKPVYQAEYFLLTLQGFCVCVHSHF